MTFFRLLLIFSLTIGNSLTLQFNFTEDLQDMKSLITFGAYTRQNPEISVKFHVDEESIVRSGLNLNKSTVLAIHGLWGHYDSEDLESIKNATLDLLPGNVIIIDYSPLIDMINLSNLTTAVAPLTAETITDLLILLYKRFDFDIQQLHIVGFSLGAQIAGVVGRFIQNELFLKVGRITALDPLGNDFYTDATPLDLRLSADDANYVEVVHTNTAIWGIEIPCGHADYYPNGGSTQPGCDLNNTINISESMLCSHKRSYQLIHDMWLPEIDHEFIVLKCSSHKLLDPDGCRWLDIKMGAYQTPINSLNSQRTQGIFYVHTNDRKPFGKGAFKMEHW